MKEYIEKIATEIIKIADFNFAELEKNYNAIKKSLGNKNIGSLSLKDLRTILAFEFLKDGAEISFAQEILAGKDSKVELLKQLAQFDY
jgi:hypothetical protein